jgi:hypothetical protein
MALLVTNSGIGSSAKLKLSAWRSPSTVERLAKADCKSLSALATSRRAWSRSTLAKLTSRSDLVLAVVARAWIWRSTTWRSFSV